jgi:hypothetical protein
VAFFTYSYIVKSHHGAIQQTSNFQIQKQQPQKRETRNPETALAIQPGFSPSNAAGN